MGSIYISPDEHLKRVMGNPGDAILRQIELSEATYPLLISYLSWLRRLNAIQNKNDVVRQNEQIFSEFIHLCEHNLLFFLTVTGRFDVIRKLFEDKTLLAKEIALLDEIEKEQTKAAAANLQNFVYVPKKKESSPLQQPEPPTPHLPPASEWEKSLFGLTNMGMYQYYEEEMKRITYVYHMKQIKLMDTSFEEHTTLMRKALDLITQDEHITEEKKQKALKIYYSLIAKKEEMQAQLNALPSLEEGQSHPEHIELIETHRQIKEEQLKEVQEVLEDFFAEIRNDSPQLQTIYEEHQEIMRSFREESQTIQLEYEQEKQKIAVHYENARIHALKDLDISLNSIIDELNKCPVDELGNEQIKQLDHGIAQLETYREKFKKTENYEGIQLLLGQCNKELERIAGIVTPILPKKEKQRLELNINLMKQMAAPAKDETKQATLDSDSPSLKNESREKESAASFPNPPLHLPEEQKIELESPKDVVVQANMELHPSVIPKGEKLQEAPLPEKQHVEADSQASVVTETPKEISQPTVANANLLKDVSLSKEQTVVVEAHTPVVEQMGTESPQSLIANGKQPQPELLPEEQKIETSLGIPDQALPPRESQANAAEETAKNTPKYRFFMNSLRDRTEFINFDAEKQRNYESVLKQLSSILNEVQEEFGPQVSAKIKVVESLVKDAQSIGFDKANPSHIQKICDACDLGIDYEPLDQIKEDLSSIVPFKNNPQNNVGM